MGYFLRRLQAGESIGMPHSRPMPSIGRRCHELRVVDAERSWRVVYRVDADAIVIVATFPKKTQQTPAKEIELCKARLRQYDAAGRG